MKRIFIIFVFHWLFVCSFGGFFATAQRTVLPTDLVGVDLKKAQNDYLRAINKGNESVVAQYADALYFDGQIPTAFDMYTRADSSEYPLNENQKRNFSHAARRLGKSSPYDQKTNYFEGVIHYQVEIEKHCVNSPQEDFAPFVWGDHLFVTSSRMQQVNKRNQERYVFTQLPFLGVLAFDADCQTSDLGFLPALNTSLHDGPIALARDTSLMVITRNYKKPNEALLQNLYLEYVVFKDGAWSDPQEFPYNDPAHSVQHPFYHDDTQTLYFSSDMPGGFGGFDLYTSKWDGQTWSTPENLGAVVNSSYDEVFPSLSPQNEIIFSSNHIETAGGLDLVIVRDNKRFLFPEPFNTPFDDLSITFIDETSGYFASNRNQSVFNDDIYFFYLKPFPFLVRVLDKSTEQPISGVSVSYSAEQPAIQGVAETSNAGLCQIHTGLEEAFTVQLSLKKSGYQDHEIVTDDFVFDGKSWVLTVYMDREVPPVVEGKFVIYFDNDYPDPRTWGTITNLSYDETFNMFKLRWPEFVARSASPKRDLDAFFAEAEKGMLELEQLVVSLNSALGQGKRYSITFTSHASPLASDNYNLALSKRRFHAVENYLLKWRDGALVRPIENGLLLYENNPFGSSQADPTVSGDPRTPERSIYGVDASRERKVTVFWKWLDF